MNNKQTNKMDIRKSLKPFINKEEHLKIKEQVKELLSRYNNPYYKSTK